ncbi:MAG TPA: glucose-6-phosphate dehydrogenase assembly protein OpcA [Candidatus Acidoferrales bacterium]|jgi:glucose-6-phosphate dehydrogenase assembly protein OpcA|nr:glucose-6-phosphate dehydrogenase assembly protein OpcA [Candidatus Acidoferrales bacterium]
MGTPGGTESTVGSTVAPERVLKELSALWVSQGKDHEAGDGAGVLRACSMTLVVLADGSDDASALGETIAAMMPEHPARAIVVGLSGAGPRALADRVQQQCWKPFGQGKQICCEQIQITASDEALADLPSVLLPLAVPDLPVIVWCRSPRLVKMPEFGLIASMATKVVLDSAAFPGARDAIRWMTDAAQSGLIIGDLSWTRLTRWREMLSHVFDNRDYLAKLAGIGEVRVEFRRPLAVSAWLMGAWVTGALEDAGVKAALNVVELYGSGGEPTLHVQLTGPDLHVELSRREGRLAISVDSLVNCTNLPQPSDYLLMREELGIVRRDAVFERSLAAAAQFAYPTDKLADK